MSRPSCASFTELSPTPKQNGLVEDGSQFEGAR